MLAREIHRLSNRKDGPMVVVDMGAITESLFESELFGHVKGSFTDAHADRIGRFEAADWRNLVFGRDSQSALLPAGKTADRHSEAEFHQSRKQPAATYQYPPDMRHKPRLG